jgi:hypothetical protein
VAAETVGVNQHSAPFGPAMMTMRLLCVELLTSTLPNPLIELLAIRLGRPNTATKSLVIPRAGEGVDVFTD